VLAFLVRDFRFSIRVCVLAAAVSCADRGVAVAQVPGPNAPPGAPASESQPSAAAPAPVAADAEPVEPAGYRTAIDSAISEYEAGRFSEARALFEAAHNVFPNARSLRGMGMAEFELRNYPASVYFLEQALASPAKPLTSELRTETEQLLARARSFVGKVTVDLQPPDARLALNGTIVQVGVNHLLTLMAGDYEMKVSAPGYSDEQRALHVAAGQESTVRVELPKQIEVLQPVPPVAAGPAPEKHDSVLASPWLWAAVGAVVAGAAVGLGFALSSGDAGPVKPSGGSTGIVLDGPPP
jgi:hypothetical protein